MLVVALVGCLAFAASVRTASAQATEADLTSTFQITPFFGQMAGGGFESPADGADRDVEADSNIGIFLNLIADVPERQYELLYTKQGTEIDGTVPVDLDIEYLQIGGLVSYPQDRHVIPYFGLTVGAARFSPDDAGLDEETKVAFSVGGGVKFPITKHLGLRLDVRGFVTLLEDDSEIFCVVDPANAAACSIRPKSDTFIQYTGSLGFTFGF
jgi:opacity protein-like surface antigen